MIAHKYPGIQLELSSVEVIWLHFTRFFMDLEATFDSSMHVFKEPTGVYYKLTGNYNSKILEEAKQKTMNYVNKNKIEMLHSELEFKHYMNICLELRARFPKVYIQLLHYNVFDYVSRRLHQKFGYKQALLDFQELIKKKRRFCYLICDKAYFSQIKEIFYSLADPIESLLQKTQSPQKRNFSSSSFPSKTSSSPLHSTNNSFSIGQKSLNAEINIHNLDMHTPPLLMSNKNSSYYEDEESCSAIYYQSISDPAEGFNGFDVPKDDFPCLSDANATLPFLQEESVIQSQKRKVKNAPCKKSLTSKQKKKLSHKTQSANSPSHSSSPKASVSSEKEFTATPSHPLPLPFQSFSSVPQGSKTEQFDEWDFDFPTNRQIIGDPNASDKPLMLTLQEDYPGVFNFQGANSNSSTKDQKSDSNISHLIGTQSNFSPQNISNLQIGMETTIHLNEEDYGQPNQTLSKRETEKGTLEIQQADPFKKYNQYNNVSANELPKLEKVELIKMESAPIHHQKLSVDLSSQYETPSTRRDQIGTKGATDIQQNKQKLPNEISEKLQKMMKSMQKSEPFNPNHGPVRLEQEPILLEQDFNTEDFSEKQRIFFDENTEITRLLYRENQYCLKVFKNLSAHDMRKVNIYVENLKRLASPRIIRYYGKNISQIKSSFEVMLLLDYKERNLQTAMKDKFITQFNDKLLIFWQIALALSSIHGNLHKEDMVHGNIKPQNILLNPKKKVFLLDFYVIKNRDNKYRAKSEGQTQAGDIWSLGLMTYFLFTDHLIDTEKAHFLISEQVLLNQIYKPSNPEIRTIYDLIERMLDINPNRRPDIEEIISHLQPIISKKTKEFNTPLSIASHAFENIQHISYSNINCPN